VDARAAAYSLAVFVGAFLSAGRLGAFDPPAFCEYRPFWAGTNANDAAQEDAAPEPEPEPESELDKMLRLAREASPVVRPQAARRFVGLGDAAARRVLEVTGGTPDGYAGLGIDLIEVLGELDDAEVRADLWQALDDVDFPWRPSAARSVAKTAKDGEAPRLRRLLGDPVATVRAAGVLGIGRLSARDALGDERTGARADVRSRLSDPDDRVRREAATLVDEWGDPSALWWLVEELKRTDRFFDLDTGRLARFDAAGRLTKRLGDAFGFAPERAPDDAENRAALERIAARVTELAGPAPELPEVARASHTDVDAVLGLEVRSCRRGELFVRWDTDGAAWVGTGNARRIELPSGAAEALLAQARARASQLEDVEFWGEPGCDVEVYYVAIEDAGPIRALRVSKGPDPEANLRPEPLTRLAGAMLGALPEDAAALRTGLAQALDAVGGSLSVEPERPAGDAGR